MQDWYIKSVEWRLWGFLWRFIRTSVPSNCIVYITITYQHIAVLQFMMFVQHQISEELDEERFVWLYTLWRIAYLQARTWLPSHATEGGHECVQSRSFWKIVHNLCKNRTLWKQNLVLFQKFVVPLPWRFIFVSPKTGHPKLFGGFFCFLCKDTKSLWHWQSNR